MSENKPYPISEGVAEPINRYSDNEAFEPDKRIEHLLRTIIDFSTNYNRTQASVYLGGIIITNHPLITSIDNHALQKLLTRQPRIMSGALVMIAVNNTEPQKALHITLEHPESPKLQRLYSKDITEDPTNKSPKGFFWSVKDKKMEYLEEFSLPKDQNPEKPIPIWFPLKETQIIQ